MHEPKEPILKETEKSQEPTYLRYGETGEFPDTLLEGQILAIKNPPGVEIQRNGHAWIIKIGDKAKTISPDEIVSTDRVVALIKDWQRPGTNINWELLHGQLKVIADKTERYPDAKHPDITNSSRETQVKFEPGAIVRKYTSPTPLGTAKYPYGDKYIFCPLSEK